jgi:hypothetical protein
LLLGKTTVKLAVALALEDVAMTVRLLGEGNEVGA